MAVVFEKMRFFNNFAFEAKMFCRKPGNGEQVRWRRGRQRWQQPDRRRGPGISIDCGIGIDIGIGIDKKYYPCSSLKQKIILHY